MKKRMISSMCALTSILILSTAYLLLQKIHIRYDNNLNHLHALEKLETISDEIHDEFNESFSYADFLAILVSEDPTMQENTIQNYANLILKQNPNISSVQLAPNGVVSFICPLQGNEAAMGHDLMADPERRQFVLDAIEKRTSIMQGPVKAKQGGSLIFNRKAIFITQDGQEKFWGLSIIAVNFSQLIGKYDQTFANADYHYAIRSVNDDGQKENIWGEAGVFQKDCVTDSVALPGETWEIAIYPDNGWNIEEKNFVWMNLFFCLVGLVVFVLTYKLAQFYQKQLEENKKEFLTRTFNKKTILKIIVRKLNEKNHRHALVLIDLNDFKKINDKFGHPVGDAVLIEVARRIEEGLNEWDKVSRFGGDEYLVYINHFESALQMQILIKSIKQLVAAQMVIDGNEIETSISAGYAVFPEEGETFEELYKVADTKMYQDKLEKDKLEKDKLKNNRYRNIL